MSSKGAQQSGHNADDFAFVGDVGGRSLQDEESSL
jgi:hypothetical protein